MSECIVPNWNLNQQRKEETAAADNQSHHHHLLPPPPPPPPLAAGAYVIPMSNYQVAELTWENGQIAMHGPTGILPPLPTTTTTNKVPTFGRLIGDNTLESIVHQATYNNNNNEKRKKKEQKRPRSSSDAYSSDHDQVVATSGGGTTCGSASANTTFCCKNNAAATGDTVMTWNNNSNNNNNSLESSRSFKSSKTTTATARDDHEDYNYSTCQEDGGDGGGSEENRDNKEEEEDVETKDETNRSDHSARRTRAALVHNQSERRRRDRINQKMKALQKLVPNASKTDKASMLDEVIQYLKQLQTQLHLMMMMMMNNTTRSATSIPQIMFMMNPIHHAMAIQQQQQHHHHMSNINYNNILARMGMGVGAAAPGMGMSGMLDMNTLLLQHGFINSNVPNPMTTAATTTFLPQPPPHFLGSQIKSPVAAGPGPFSDPYGLYLAQVCQQKQLSAKQSMNNNMDIYNKMMAAMYRQQSTNKVTHDQDIANSSQ